MSRRLVALLLAVTLLFTSATACTLCSITPDKEVTKRTVTVKPLAAESGGDGWKGTYAKSKITVEVNPSKKVEVGFYETEAGGQGSQSKSAGWMAAIIGSLILGRDMSDYKFTFSDEGYVDGPSAGATMTIGILSAMLGDKLKEDVVMTGTINPDGTVGPIGGIPQKIEGAKAAKAKKMLIPSGQRYDYDLNTDESVDVVNLGSDKGIEVIEVKDIYEAYKEFTGKELPKSADVSTKSFELPKETFDKVKAKTVKWYSRYLEERNKYDQVALPFDTSYIDIYAEDADAYADQGDKYLGQGLIGSAYNQMTSATLYASLAYHSKKSLEAYIAGGLPGAAAYLNTVSPSEIKIDALFDDLKARKPQTLADTMVLAKAYGTLSTAFGLKDQAESELESAGVDETENLQKVMSATLAFVAAGYVVDAAEDQVDFGMGMGKAKPVSKDKVTRMSEALRRAAKANLDYFDSIVLRDIAEEKGVSLDIMRGRLASIDTDYVYAWSAWNSAETLKRKLGSSDAEAIAVLGNAMESFNLTSQLIAKYYSLGVELDDNYNIVGISQEKAMINMLDLGEQTALENINAASKAGATPVLAMLDYEAGKTLREGTVGNKISALGDFWNAGMAAKVLTVLLEMKVKRAGDEAQGGFTKILGAKED
jgi:predicted S18 family serine protease